MTFHYTDASGHSLETEPDTNLDGTPTVTFWAHRGPTRIPVRIPVDHVEELIAGIRDTARQCHAHKATP